jgi:hypothetical protein
MSRSTRTTLSPAARSPARAAPSAHVASDDALESLSNVCVDGLVAQGVKFQACSLVAWITADTTYTYGFWYDMWGGAHQWSPQDTDGATAQAAEAFQRASARVQSPAWDVCVVKISVPRGTVKASFFYGPGAAPWTTDPYHGATLAERARP